MADENRHARLTAFGQEDLLQTHELRLDAIEKSIMELDDRHDRRLKDLESKESARDKRWDTVVKGLVAIALAAVGSLVTALITLGIHP